MVLILKQNAYHLLQFHHQSIILSSIIFLLSGISYENQTNALTSDYSNTLFAIGPEIGYALGSQNSTSFQYVNVGWNYQKNSLNYNGNSSVSGSGLSVGLGLIIPLKSHFGFVVEGKYKTLNYSVSDFKNNTISLNLGFVGLLF